MVVGTVRKLLARRRKRTWIIGGVAALVIVGGAVAVARVTGDDGADQAGAETQTVEASLETLEQSIEATGTLTPAVQEDVNFEASGTVTSVEVKAGDTVTAGQTLATVDPLTMEAALLQAKADLADAEAQLASAEEQDDGSSLASAQISARDAAVSVAEQALESAQTAADGTTLTAPVSGLVTSVSLSVGDTVGSSSSQSSSGQGSSGTGDTSGSSTTPQSSTDSESSTSSAQFTIVGTDAWSVSVAVGEADVASIEASDQVELETSDGTQLFGVVSEVGLLPSTTSGTATFPVTISITGETEGLYDGTSVTATIIYERRTDVLTVPSSAVTTGEDGTSTVTVVDDNGDESEREVTTGEVSGDLTEITEGLDEGELVLVTVFTPGSGGTGEQGGMPGGGEMPDGGGEMPSGQMPEGGQMPSGGFPGGGSQ